MRIFGKQNVCMQTYRNNRIPQYGYFFKKETTKFMGKWFKNYVDKECEISRVFFKMKTNILWDFEICIKVLLKR